MSGIETRSRLEQLHALRNRIDQEIAAELRLNPPPRRPPKPTESALLLAELGVTAKHVKEWACTQGLIPAVVRGRVALALVDAYAAHMDARAQLDQDDHDVDEDVVA